MGEAWLARDAERGEDVVAKVLPAGAPAEKLALLRREARLVRKLHHPRTVPVYGFRSGERASAVTLRYMRGGDASRRRGAPPHEVARLGRDVAEALEYLHGLGVVHRDVKPSNVLLDEEGRAHLADFGIATVLEGGEEGGVVLRGGGSRASMSPQQRAGGAPSPADDLYALGALLYELLSGRPPFPPEATDQEILARDPPPVASPFPVPCSLRALVGSLLARTPAERPPSAAAVMEARDAIAWSVDRSPAAPSRPPLPLQPPPRVDEGGVSARPFERRCDSGLSRSLRARLRRRGGRRREPRAHRPRARRLRAHAALDRLAFRSLRARRHVGADPRRAARPRSVPLAQPRCFECHRLPFEAPLAFGLGLPSADDGVGALSGVAAQRGLFGVPTLRNVAATAPYMHDGSLATLEAVVRFYDHGAGQAPGKSSLIQPLRLSEGERSDLVAFLLALDGRELAGLMASRPADRRPRAARRYR